MAIQIQYRRGLASEWTAANTVLAVGEPGYETDTGKFKVGDGSTAWISLPYSSGPAGPILPTFSYQGALAIFTGKQRFYLDRSCSITLVRASVGTASSSGSVTIELFKNGTSIGTTNITATNFTATTTPTVSFASGDYITASITAAGTGATDLTIEISIA